MLLCQLCCLREDMISFKAVRSVTWKNQPNSAFCPWSCHTPDCWCVLSSDMFTGSGPVSNKARRLQIQQLLQDSSTGEYRSERSIARIAGCDKKTVRRWRVRFSSGNLSVEDAPRQGRQPAVRDESLQAVLDLIKSEQPRSSRDIASLLSSREIANMAPRTVRKYMERTNMAHGLAVPPLSAEEKSARFAFAARHCNFDWTAVMLTDSRTFCLAKREGKVWYPRGTTPVQPLPRDTPVVHAYYGMTEHGATRPFFVVCADPQLSPANDMRSDQPENGVTADEYVQDVLYPLLDEGDRLFKRKGYANSWIFQQQGAKANASQDARDVLDAVMGERWITDWPANSPDLSCFENAWTWVNDKLDDRRPHLHSVDDLKTAVTEALQSMPLWYCKYHLRAMRRRMERVAKSDGDRI